MKHFLSFAVVLFCIQVALGQKVEITILDATVKDKVIQGAEVILQKNGQQSIIGQSNANGKVSLNSTFSDDENSLIIIKKAGYSTLTAKCTCNGLTYALSPRLTDINSTRIVLSWGVKPQDIDSHLSFGNNHVYFSKKTGVNANLDVDDIDSYGPETITIKKRQVGSSYIYAVHDYTNRTKPNSKELSLSGAKVFVYTGQSLVKTYYIPKNVPGNLWVLFKITDEGEFQEINKIVGINIDNREITSEIEKQQNAIQAVATYYNPDAVKLNNDGEVAYHQKKYSDAVNLYQLAIDKDPNFGQAYSNLGLVYQKLNIEAEAIWANSKAIGLANGPDKNDVKASSFYNIARIYENRGDYADAIRYLEFAKRYKVNPVYNSSIERIRTKMR